MKKTNRTTHASLPETDLKLGAHGEDYIIRNAFLLFGSSVKEDRRKDNIEGELLLHDNRLVEVKADFTGYPLTRGTVAVEVKNPKSANNEGWYQCCKRNGVDIIVWTCYRMNTECRPKRLPYKILVISFKRLTEYIDIEKAYRKTRNPNLISINIKDVLRYCGDEAALFKSVYPVTDKAWDLCNLPQHIREFFESNGLTPAKKPSQILINDHTHLNDKEDIK